MKKLILLAVNKLLRGLGFKLVSLEGGLKIRKYFRDKSFIVGNYRLLAPASHSLSRYMRQHKFYSKNLPRLVNYISYRQEDFVMADVGANIGDTAAFVNSLEKQPDKIFCFEGSNAFLPYLKKNTKGMDNVVVFETFLGEFEDNVNLSQKQNSGTLRLDSNAKECELVSLTTLDTLAEKHEQFNKIRFLKTDTDGYDFKILRGGRKLIEQTKPVLFFEYDRNFLEQANDDRFSTLDMLISLGYDNAIVYDNYGKMLLSLSLVNNLDIFEELDLYIKDGDAPINYYDICLFNKSDDKLFQEIVEKEKRFFSEN